jgi:urease accessory protein
LNLADSNSSELMAQPGYASLEVNVVFGESTALKAFAASPMKLLTPRTRGKSVWAYASNFGGGLVAGDQTHLDIRLGANARCFVGTQASTKVYRNPCLLPCGHVTDAELEAGSVLFLAPDPVQAYAGSTYSQRQEFRLAGGAGLLLVDWFTSGRAARGERWAFQSFHSRNEVFINGHRVFLDSLLLDPADGDLTEAHRMGRFNCLAMLLLIGAPVRAAADQLLAGVGEKGVTARAEWTCSASPVREGAVLRIAGESVETVGRELHRHLGWIHDMLGDDPWTRKW